MKKPETQGAYQSVTAGIQPADVNFEWNTEGTVLTIKPKAQLAYATGTDPGTLTALTYAFSLTDAAADLAGNKLAPVNSNFKTLRQITARITGDPAQDGSTDGVVVSNGNIDFQVSNTKQGFLGFKLSNLPTGLPETSLIAAALKVNVEFSSLSGTELVGVEHLIFGDTLTTSAYTSAILRNLGNLNPDTAKGPLWKTADVLAAAKEDLKNRGTRNNRSQYRLRCLNCVGNQVVTFIAAEAKDTAGSFKELVPELVVEYVLP